MQTYAPKKVNLIIGNHRVTGFITGTMVTAERNADAVTYEPGAYPGEGLRIKNHDRSGRFTFSTLQSSPSNAVLSLLIQTDEEADDVTFPVLLQDLNGNTLVTGDESWFVKYPSLTRATDHSPNEWVVETRNMTIVVGSTPD